MNIHPPRAAISINNTIQFLGVGGIAPYTYALKKGKGGIDATTGVYASPSSPTSAIIRVSDINGQFVDANILVGSPLALFCDILQQELGLDDGEIYLWDQKIDKPKGEGLFIAVAETSCKPFSNIRKMDPSDGSTFQSTNFLSRLDVNAISRGVEARDRRAEILMALNSFYSETQQAMNGFRIYPITTSFVNLSEGDGAAIPYRYVISVSMAWAQSKVTQTPFFDTFPTPLIEIDQ